VDVVRRAVADIARRVFWGNCEASLRLAAEDRLVLTQCLQRRTSTSTQSVMRNPGRSISFEEACPTIPRNNLLETYMQPCDACRELVGKPSSVPPHGDLAASGVGAFDTEEHACG
jgi:hypothetical protein